MRTILLFVIWPHTSQYHDSRVMYSGVVCFLSKHWRTIACGRKHFFRSRISDPVRNRAAVPRGILEKHSGKDTLKDHDVYLILACSTRRKKRVFQKLQFVPSFHRPAAILIFKRLISRHFLFINDPNAINSIYTRVDNLQCNMQFIYKYFRRKKKYIVICHLQSIRSRSASRYQAISVVSWCRRCRRRASKRSFRRKDRSRRVLRNLQAHARENIFLSA